MKPEAAFELSDKTPYQRGGYRSERGRFIRQSPTRGRKSFWKPTGRPTNVAAWQSIALGD